MIFDTIINLKDSFKREPIALNMDEASVKSIIDQYNDLKLGVDAFTERTNLSDDAIKSYLSTVESGNATFSGFTQHINATNNSIGLMGIKAKSTTLLIGGLKAAAGMLATTLITIAIGKIIEGFDNLIHRKERIAEAAETARNKINELNNAFKENKKSIDDIKNRYAELAQGVDLISNKNLTLSTEDYEEFLSLSNQLSELFPNLTRSYDSNGNAILNLSGNVNTIVGSLDALINREQQLLNLQITKEMPDVYEGYKQNIDDYNEELDLLLRKNKALQNLISTDYSINESPIDGSHILSWKFDGIRDASSTDIQNEIYNALQTANVDLTKVIVDTVEDLETGGQIVNLSIPEIELEDYDNIETLLGEYFSNINNDIQYARTQLESETSKFNSYLNTWLSTEPQFQKQDTEVQTVLKEMLFNGNWISEALKDSNVDGSWDSLANWIERNYLYAIDKINDKEIKKKIISLGQINNPKEKINVAQYLQDYFDKNKIPISLDFILDENNPNSTQSIINSVTEKNRQIAGSLDGLKVKYEELKKAREEAYYKSNFVGNVDINNRPVVTDSSLGGDYQTSYTGFQEYWKGDEENGHYEIIHFTPILPDGTVLDDKTLYNYLDNVIANADNALEADKTENGGFGILYKVDTTVGGSKITDSNLDSAFKQAELWDMQMHEKQAAIYDKEASALVDYNKVLDEHNKLNQYFADNSIDTDAEYNKWLEVTINAKNATEAIYLYDKYLDGLSNKETNFFTDKNIEAIDEYKNKISDLSSYLQTISSEGKLSAEDISTLNTEYKIVASSTEEYRKAIIAEMNAAVQNSDVLTLLKEAIKNCDDAITKSLLMSLYDSLLNINEEAQETTSSFYDLEASISTLESSASLLRELDELIKEQDFIDTSKANDILSVFPEMAEEVAKYNAGLITSEELFSLLEEAYETDKSNYAKAIAYKMRYDEDYFDDFVKTLPDWVKNLAEAYGIDLENYRTLNEQKLALDKEYAKRKNILDNHTSLIDATEKIKNNSDTIIGKELANKIGISLQESYGKAKEEYDAIEKIINGVSDSFTADADWKEFGYNEKEGKSGSDDKFDQDINWIEQSLSNANREVSNINEELANTKGFKERLLLYGELEKANANLVKASKEATSEYEQEWTNASKKISSSYINKIKLGETFEIEDFSNETTYNNVKAAQDAYNTWQESIQEQNKALQQQEEAQQDKVGTLLEYEEIKLDINSLDLEEAETAKDKNNLLQKEQKIKEKILEYSLLLAKTDEEKVKLQKEYNQYLKDNEILQYENLKSERDNQISFYDSEIQDIQNDIDLEEARGGQGTEKQYNGMNENLEIQKGLYEDSRIAALEMRDKQTYGTDEWEKFNQEVQDAENNINKCTIAQIENNRAILLLPVKKYEKANEELQETLDQVTGYREKIESAIGYVNSYIQDQIDLLNENKEAVNDYYDSQIKPIQARRDLLTETNDELKRQIDLENAKYNLEKAKSNKTNRVYRKGEGFVYEADHDAIRDAQDELDQQIHNNAIAELDKMIDSLNNQKEKEIEVLDDKIKAWDKYSKNIDKVTSSYEKYKQMQDFIDVFGSSAIERVMAQDTTIITKFEEVLNVVKGDENSLKEQIEANNNAIKEIQKEANAYIEGSSNVITARNNITKVVKNNEEELLALKGRTDKVTEYSSGWSKAFTDISTALGNIELANITAKDNEATIIGERQNALKSFKEAAVSYYNQIAIAVANAQSSFSKLTDLLKDAKNTYADVVEYTSKANNKVNDAKSNSTAFSNESYIIKGVKVSKYHDGGIVGKNVGSKQLPDFLMSLAESPLQPNEAFAKLLNGEVVLNNNQMGNLFNNIGNVVTPLASNIINKNTQEPLNISIGDVNVYNPDNSDMIVNEIVKELPLKVMQKLSSR